MNAMHWTIAIVVGITVAPVLGEPLIIVEPDAPHVARFAAEQLQHYLWRATDVTVPIVTDGQGQPRYLIGEGAARGIINVDADDLGPDGYLIRRIGGDVIIAGDDVDRGTRGGLPFDPRTSRTGTLYGVYRYLERHHGIRWLWPGESGEVVPTQQALALPAQLDEKRAPAMMWRHLFLNGRGGLTQKDIDACYLWYLRQGMGISIGSPYSFGHSWAYLIDGNNNFETHPDWYSLIDGKRTPFRVDENGRAIAMGRQICTSNRELIDYIAAKICSRYAPDDAAIANLSPNDGGGFCECDACRALDHQDRYAADQGYEGKVLSDRLFTFVNAVAQRVRQTHPNVRVGCFAYTYARPAPRSIESLDSNVVISLTQQVQLFNRTPDARRRHQQRLAAWLAMGNQIVLREYIGYYGQAAVMSPMTTWSGELMQMANNHRDRIFGIYSETTFAGLVTNHLDFTVMARLAWDPSLTIDAVKDDFFKHGFTDAAEPMATFYVTLEEAYCAAEDELAAYLNGADMWLTPAVEQQARHALAEARRHVSQQPEVCGRIDTVERMFNYTVALARFIGTCKQMSDRGLPMQLRGYTPSGGGEAVTRDQVINLIEKSERAYHDVIERIAELKQPESGVIYSSDGFDRLNRLARWGDSIEEYRRLFDDPKTQAMALPVTWRFRLDPDNRGESERWFDQPIDDQWSSIRLDDTWEKQGYGQQQFGTPDGYNGLAWYRLPALNVAVKKGSRYMLRLGAVDESCRVYANGQLAGAFSYNAEIDPQSWKKPLVFDITSHLRTDQPNDIAVCVIDRSGAGGIWKRAWLITKPIAASSMLLRETFDDDTWRDKLADDHTSAAEEMILDAGALRVRTGKEPLKHAFSASWVVDDLPTNREFQFQLRCRTADMRENDASERWLRRPQVPMVRIIPVGPEGKVLVKPAEYQWIGLPFAESTNEWTTLRRVFRAPDDATRLRVTIFLNASGAVWLDDLELRTLE